MRIKDLREDNDFTQQQIADLLHIKQNTYSQYETGQRQIPIATLITLALFYNTSIDYLLGITDIKEPYPKNKHTLRIQKTVINNIAIKYSPGWKPVPSGIFLRTFLIYKPKAGAQAGLYVSFNWLLCWVSQVG